MFWNRNAYPRAGLTRSSSPTGSITTFNHYCTCWIPLARFRQRALSTSHATLQIFPPKNRLSLNGFIPSYTPFVFLRLIRFRLLNERVTLRDSPSFYSSFVVPSEPLLSLSRDTSRVFTLRSFLYHPTPSPPPFFPLVFSSRWLAIIRLGQCNFTP